MCAADDTEFITALPAWQPNASTQPAPSPSLHISTASPRDSARPRSLFDARIRLLSNTAQAEGADGGARDSLTIRTSLSSTQPWGRAVVPCAQAERRVGRPGR